jgi:hypothetical protein
VDVANAQLMAGQMCYRRIGASASASMEHKELMCLRAMRTPVNIPSAPTDGYATTQSAAAAPQSTGLDDSRHPLA